MLSGGQAQLLSLLQASAAAHALRAVTQLKLAEHLGVEPCSAHDAAEAVGASPAKVYRLMRALACFGIFIEHQDGRFSLGDAGQALIDNPSMQAAVIYSTEPDILRAWMQLADAVACDWPVFASVHGHSFYEHLREHDRLAEVFHLWMGGIGRLHVPVILEAYNFAPFGNVADIGGGQGDLLLELLTRHPHMCGVLLEQPEVARSIRAELSETVRPRLLIREGSFFDVAVPGADLYILKNIIHNWEDEDALHILRRCREGMHDAATLLVIEHIVPEGPGFHVGKLLDLSMMVTIGGLERTESEHRLLLEASGLKVLQHIRTESPLELLECRPIIRS